VIKPIRSQLQHATKVQLDQPLFPKPEVRGSQDKKTSRGLHVETPRDVLILLVEEFNTREILETINKVGVLDKKSHEVIAFHIDVEDAVGVMHQVDILNRTLKEEV